jgi:tetratricopeptide (TPR) repeat protein
MQRWTRAALSGSAVLVLTAGMLAVGAAAGAPPPPPSAAAGTTTDTTTDTATRPRASATSVAALQDELDRVPGKWPAWSSLGLAYVEQARLTADPTLYDKAAGAFDRSLQLHPEGNDAALTGQATLAAARHDFAEALALTDRALAVNEFSPTTWAVRSDALTELGRHDEARAAVQRLLDLSPGTVDGLTRAAYVHELRGDVVRARQLLQEAAAVAERPADTAFAQYYLGELAWNEGDLQAARAAYDAGLAADPGYLPLRAGRAKVLAASGDAAAAAEYRRLVEQQPLPEFVIAYGELLEARGQTDAAQEQYAVVRAVQELYAANGQDVDTELALFEADHGTPAAAVASAQKAYAKRPDALHTQDAYAWALHVAGRSAEALPVARAVARSGLRSPLLAYHLGVIEAATGDPVAARAALQRALDLNPAFSAVLAPRARALLADLSS